MKTLVSLSAIFAIFIAPLAAAAPAAPIAVPTFECVGIYWSPAEGAADNTCNVRYRAEGGEWHEALPLWFDTREATGEGMDSHGAIANEDQRHGRAPVAQPFFARQYRGSIVNLQPGTGYEIELRLAKGPSATVHTKTWSEDFPVARTVYLPKSGQKTLEITESGSPMGYIVYTGRPDPGATIDAANQVENNVTIKASYVILRGLTLKGAQSHAVEIEQGSHDVVIEDCDISGWGMPDRLEGEKWGDNMQAAIYARDEYAKPTIERVIVQRCYLHHPRHDTNSWQEFRKRMDEPGAGRWHPNGPQCVTFYDTKGNHVFRYNRCESDADHYFNDILGGGSNYGAAGFPNRDSDIYGNYLADCWDDAIESEGANCNVRIWNNYITDSFTAIATACAHVGPMYIWRNVTGEMKCSPDGVVKADRAGPFLKAGSGRGFGGGRTYVFHNTLLQPNSSEGKPQGAEAGLTSNGGPIINHVSRNNVFQVRGENNSSFAEKPPVSKNNDFDHDLYNGKISGATKEQETHGIQGVPVYAPAGGAGVSALAPTSPGFDAGVRIPNFNDSYAGAAPDMGAKEAGTPELRFGPEAYPKR